MHLCSRVHAVCINDCWHNEDTALPFVEVAVIPRRRSVFSTVRASHFLCVSKSCACFNTPTERRTEVVVRNFYGENINAETVKMHVPMPLSIQVHACSAASPSLLLVFSVSSDACEVQMHLNSHASPHRCTHMHTYQGTFVGHLQSCIRFGTLCYLFLYMYESIHRYKYSKPYGQG